MHVLLLPSWYKTADKPWRGTFVEDQALALARAGLQVGVAFVERRSLSLFAPIDLVDNHFQTVARDEEGIPTIRMKGWSTFAHTVAGSLLWSRLTQRLVRSYVEVYGLPDVIHGHAALWGGHAAMMSAQSLGRPYVITEHSSSILTQSLSEAERNHAAVVYRDAAAVVAVSRSLQKSVNDVAGLPVAEIVPNTVDTAYFSAPHFKQKGQPFTFLAVCDLVGYKKVDVLIRAFVRLLARNSEIRLVIIGAGKEAGRLREIARSPVAEHKIHFTGALPRWRVRQWLGDADALVLPSEHETFGVVLIEALSTGIPVIATRSGGPEEIVTSDTGILIEPNDEDALLRAMSDILVRRFDPALLRESARHHFDYPVVSRRLCGIYERLTAHQRKVA